MKPTGRQFSAGLAVLLAGILGAAVSLAVLAGIGDLGKSTTTVVSEPSETPSNVADSTSASGKSLTIPEIYERTAPGVVQVTSTQVVSTQLNPFFPSTQKATALGSGFVIDKQGHIVTNNHVIAGATPGSIEVTFSNNAKVKATVVGTDKTTDLAVLKVNVPSSALVPLSFGDSSALEVGDSVVAIGNPFGLDRTVTSGIVSAIYSPGADTGNNIANYPLTSSSSTSAFEIPAIQTDAAINHGNSGGPLINSLGQVVGVNTSIETGGTSQGNVGIGFAIQSNTVKQVVAQIIKTGKASHAYIGVTITPITPALSNLVRLPVKQGILVESVKAGTGAAKAGLKAGTTKMTVAGQPFTLGGDIIVGIDGVKVGSSAQKLEDIIAAHKPGDTVSLEIYRGNKKMTVTVTLGNR